MRYSAHDFNDVLYGSHFTFLVGVLLITTSEIIIYDARAVTQ